MNVCFWVLLLWFAVGGGGGGGGGGVAEGKDAHKKRTGNLVVSLMHLEL